MDGYFELTQHHNWIFRLRLGGTSSQISHWKNDMDKVETIESWYTTSDNNQLFTRTWKAVGNVKAKLV